MILKFDLKNAGVVTLLAYTTRAQIASMYIREDVIILLLDEYLIDNRHFRSEAEDLGILKEGTL